MKKLLFVLPHMLSGGVEKSILDLVDLLPRNEFDITIMLVEKEGAFLKLIPDDIHLREMSISNQLRDEIIKGGGAKEKVLTFLKQGEIATAMSILYRKGIRKDPLGIYSESFDSLQSISEEYDIAVCYHIHCFFLIRYVAEKVIAKVKVCWVHNDFSDVGFNLEDFEKDLAKYNRIYCVSKQVADEVNNKIPLLSDKVRLFYNIINKQRIMEKSNEYKPIEINNKATDTVILSVGRLEVQKGFDAVIDVAKELKDENYQFKWLILGEGTQLDALKSKILNSNLSDTVILCGIRENPYPYYKNCDIYVQPSRHEGYGIALAEARCLGCAIISTEFAGAKEQINNGVTGTIVSFGIESIKGAIRDYLENPDKVERMKNNLVAQEFENTYQTQIADFIGLID